MISVAPLHHASHFDPTDVTSYAVPMIPPPVRAIASPSPSLFEILVSDQISAHGSKSAAQTNELSQPAGNSNDEQFTSTGLTGTLRSSRVLTIADVQANRLGLNFEPSTTSIGTNSLNVASDGSTGRNPPEQSQISSTNPFIEASAKGLTSQELSALASSVQRFLPQSMIAFDGPAPDVAATSESQSNSPGTAPQSSPAVQSTLNAPAQIPTSNQITVNASVVQRTLMPGFEYLVGSPTAQMVTTAVTPYIDVDQSRSTAASPDAASVKISSPKIGLDSFESSFGQRQNASERLATAVADYLGQAASGGPSSVSIRLTLPELGIVVLYLSITNGVVSVRIGVKNSRAKRTLENQLNELRKSLIERDVNCDECLVEDESDEQPSTEFKMSDAPSDLEKQASPSRWSQAVSNSLNQTTGSITGNLNFIA